MTPAASHAFTAAAHAYAADVFRASSSPAQRAFAPTLDQWAANALARSRRAEAGEQPDLFTKEASQ